MRNKIFKIWWHYEFLYPERFIIAGLTLFGINFMIEFPCQDTIQELPRRRRSKDELSNK